MCFLLNIPSPHEHYTAKEYHGTRIYLLSTCHITWNKWQFGVSMLMPFGKYDQGSKQINHYNSNVKHMRVDLRIPYISVSYNLQWGRQKRGAQKLINVDANAYRSTVGGR